MEANLRVKQKYFHVEKENYIMVLNIYMRVNILMVKEVELENYLILRKG